MNITRSIFREYDVRGIVGTQLTPEFAEHLGRAYATTARARVGRDPGARRRPRQRPSGDALAAAAARGRRPHRGHGHRRRHGADARAVLRRARRSASTVGVQVTGSHNPPEFNGFKMVAGGDSLHGEAIQDSGR